MKVKMTKDKHAYSHECKSDLQDWIQLKGLQST